jgi:hypothetical protein
LLFLGSAALIPYAVLTIDESKSPVVGNIFVPIFVLGNAAAFGAAERIIKSSSRQVPLLFMSTLAVAVLAVGFVTELTGLLTIDTPRRDSVDAREADQLLLSAGDYVDSYLGGSAAWSTDGHFDYTWFQAAMAYYYERTGRLLNLSPTELGQGPIDGILSRDQILQLAIRSDVLILPALDDSVINRQSPIDVAIASLVPELRNFAASHFVTLGDFDVYGRTLRLYARPAVALRGTSGPWITASGVDLRVPKLSWNGPSCVTLDGSSNLAWLPESPRVAAKLNGPSIERQLPSTFDATGNNYEIRVDLPPPDGAMISSTPVHLDFSSYFVPSEIGINADSRPLVLLAPTSTRVTPGTCAL